MVQSFNCFSAGGRADTCIAITVTRIRHAPIHCVLASAAVSIGDGRHRSIYPSAIPFVADTAAAEDITAQP